ncbi:MAG: TonB-dependent receptor [Chitinophagaceae bacterium]|nr:TonB-dependent receptor [Chitinophagaceae bacterium]
MLLDKSDLYAVEGNYNLTPFTKSIADILIGANYKKYILNSQGTLFADSTGAIKLSQYGAYIQASRQIMDRISLTVSGRYDKADNFKGRFTPRVTALFKIMKDNNIRLSYQTAYRFPSNQQQFINLQVGSTRLIGSNPTFAAYINYINNPLYTFTTTPGSSTLTNFKAFTPPEVKPEAVSSFELGYKGLLMDSKLLIDVYGYYGQYQDFLGRTNTIQTLTGNASDTSNASKRRNISVR